MNLPLKMVITCYIAILQSMLNLFYGCLVSFFFFFCLFFRSFLLKAVVSIKLFFVYSMICLLIIFVFMHRIQCFSVCAFNILADLSRRNLKFPLF